MRLSADTVYEYQEKDGKYCSYPKTSRHIFVKYTSDGWILIHIRVFIAAEEHRHSFDGTGCCQWRCAFGMLGRAGCPRLESVGIDIVNIRYQSASRWLCLLCAPWL